MVKLNAFIDRIYAPVSLQNSLIVNGVSLQIGIKIIEVTYNIEFKETGLPLGITWYVNIPYCIRRKTYFIKSQIVFQLCERNREIVS